jgi:sodium-dependent dicarboxylate transporter 2/3/5
LTRDQIEVLSVFAIVMAGWLTQSSHDQSPSIVALAGTIALMLLGRIETDDLGTISWPTLLTFGGGLTMGVAMVDSGASDWIMTRLTGASDWPTPLAGLIGVDPVMLVVVVAIASSVDFPLVIGTPPTMLAYSTGLFTSGEILRGGALLDILGIAILVGLVVPFWQLTGAI